MKLCMYMHCFCIKRAAYTALMLQNNISDVSEHYIRHVRTIYVTRQNYISFAYRLYIPPTWSVYPSPTICFPRADHLFFFSPQCTYFDILLCFRKMLIFFLFFCLRLSDARNGAILVVHKMQSVISKARLVQGAFHHKRRLIPEKTIFFFFLSLFLYQKTYKYLSLHQL